MKPEFFSLESGERNRLTKIFQIIFGIICIAVATIWLILNFNSLKSSGTLWITIIFLMVFGYYQIISGLGKAEKFIEIGKNRIRLKRNSFLPPTELNAGEIEKIEIFPLNIVFFIKQSGTTILRFGTTYTDNIKPVKESILNFTEANAITVEEKIEEF